MITIAEYIEWKQPVIYRILEDPRKRIRFYEWKNLMETAPGFERGMYR